MSQGCLELAVAIFAYTFCISWPSNRRSREKKGDFLCKAWALDDIKSLQGKRHSKWKEEKWVIENYHSFASKHFFGSKKTEIQTNENGKLRDFKIRSLFFIKHPRPPPPISVVNEFLMSQNSIDLKNVKDMLVTMLVSSSSSRLSRCSQPTNGWKTRKGGNCCSAAASQHPRAAAAASSDSDLLYWEQQQ